MPENTLEQLLYEELTPAPDPQFAAEMDEWAAAGFPHRETRERKRRTWSLLPLRLAGACTAAAAVVAIGAVVAQGPEGVTESGGGGSGTSARGVTEQAAPSVADDSAGSAAPVPGGGVAPGERDRRIERSAQLTLGAPADDFQSVADRIVQVTDRHDGFVLRSQVTTGDSPSGDFQLRIPGSELQAALRDLSALAEVRARSDAGQDVTREYVSVTDSLQAARAERRALLRRLATATDEARIQRLRDRLDANARELTSLRGAIRQLRERTNYAAVAVSLVEGKDKGGGAGAGGTSDALNDSLALLVGSFNWLLRALGVVIPASLVAGAAWWGARAIRRRRREAVLF